MRRLFPCGRRGKRVRSMPHPGLCFLGQIYRQEGRDVDRSERYYQIGSLYIDSDGEEGEDEVLRRQERLEWSVSEESEGSLDLGENERDKALDDAQQGSDDEESHDVSGPSPKPGRSCARTGFARNIFVVNDEGRIAQGYAGLGQDFVPLKGLRDNVAFGCESDLEQDYTSHHDDFREESTSVESDAYIEETLSSLKDSSLSSSTSVQDSDASGQEKATSSRGVTTLPKPDFSIATTAEEPGIAEEEARSEEMDELNLREVRIENADREMWNLVALVALYSILVWLIESVDASDFY